MVSTVFTTISLSDYFDAGRYNFYIWDVHVIEEIWCVALSESAICRMANETISPLAAVDPGNVVWCLSRPPSIFENAQGCFPHAVFCPFPPRGVVSKNVFAVFTATPERQTYVVGIIGGWLCRFSPRMPPG